MKRAWQHSSVIKLVNTENGENPVNIIKEKARSLTLKAFNKGWSGPPYNPVELSQLLGINVIPNELVNDARILPVGKEGYQIEYNPFQNAKRINFSLAHEIAHTLFPDCNERVRNREEKGNTEWELELLCDIAAAEILLPYGEFLAYANDLPICLDTIFTLSDKFNASLESVLLRYCDVVEKPCTFALATFVDENQKDLRVKYSRSSTLSRLSLKRNFRIPRDSSAYDCLNSGWSSNGKENWNVFPDPKVTVYSIGLPPLKYENKNRVGILIVPTENAPEPKGKLHTITRDATEPTGEGTRIIVQVVNTAGALGAGFGKAMSKRYPISRESIMKWKSDRNEFRLGATNLVQLDEDLHVFQIIAQEGIRPRAGRSSLKYEFLRKGLQELTLLAKEMRASIHMPKIGAGQAGGEWSVIEGMIEEEVVLKGIDVTVYVLPGSKKQLMRNNTLTLFD